jgi:hypothetical protein
MTAPYRLALGPAFDGLPEALKRLHGGPSAWRGTARITHGNAVARRMARTLGYPDAEGDVPMALTITPEDAAERWTRDFDGHRVVSVHRPAPGGRVAERLAGATILLAPTWDGAALHLRIAATRLGPLPAPGLLSGGGTERAEGGGLTFDVAGRAPGIGLLIRYRGRLDPA